MGPTADGGTERVVSAGPWRVRVSIRPGVPRIESVAALVRVMQRTLLVAGAPAPASIGLILTGDEELAGLNVFHMGTPGPTDVLSFPLLPPDAFPPHEGADRTSTPGSPGAAFVLPPGVRPDLGDVVVSVERAIAQARAGTGGQTGDARWSPREELRLLVTHGTLHVCGWDHAAPAEETAMRRLETALLKASPERRSAAG